VAVAHKVQPALSQQLAQVEQVAAAMVEQVAHQAPQELLAQLI
jgi:hypothetical protein